MTISPQSNPSDRLNVTPINGPYGGLYYSCTIGSWSAGDYTYVIRSTDSTGGSSSSMGTFTVASTINQAPSIGSVVVVEAAAAARDGVMKTNEKLVITWAATSLSGIASQTVLIDGATIAPIYGPYGGLYYSCPIGNWSAGAQLHDPLD